MTKLLQTQSRALIMFVLLMAALLISGCASTPLKTTTPPVANAAHFASLQSISGFEFSGRIGIQIPKQGYSGSIKWQHSTPNNEHITFYSPLGSQVAEIIQTPNQATLTNHKGQTFTALTAEGLIRSHLGWQLPVTQLNNWLLGRPNLTQVNPKSITFDVQGRLSSFSQQDWQVQYTDYATWQETALPGKIRIKGNGISLKVIAKDWQLIKH